ncbi:MAG: helix-turn-helix domain-containing protein [Novosphingobium sp.]
MRRDATQNRQLLIDTASDLFHVCGPDVALDTVAERAGVGIGTLYRHFPNRAALLRAVFEAHLDHYASFAEGHRGGPDLIPDFLRLIAKGASTYALAAGHLHAHGPEAEASRLVLRRFDAIAETVIGRARADGQVADWVTSDTLRLCGRMLLGLLADARATGEAPDTDGALRIMLSGIGSRASS